MIHYPELPRTALILYMPLANAIDRWVQTDMGRSAAAKVGMEDAPVTIEQSVAGLSKTVGSFSG
jgi:hypothetical protein